jgi:hypothetical protein
MNSLIRIATLPLLAIAAVASAQPAGLASSASPPAAARAAGSDSLAWDIVEGLTTEVGQRLAGTEAEARARDWAVAKLTGLGFANVRIEPFDMPVWVRGGESAEIVSPFPQKLVLAALGNSAATPAGGITAEVVRFADLAQLEAASPVQVRGKIVYVTHGMTATQDGSSYGAFGVVRRKGPSIASAKGAAAIVIRSIGTDEHRNPHTGVQTWDAGARPIPAAALSLPDAEQLDRIFARGRPVKMKLVLTPRNLGKQQSGNVIAEVPGRRPDLGVVLVGCHLDSWDFGTGAIDDAAGCAIVAAAAKQVMGMGQPLRTIRVVWFGAEEVGLFGGLAYRDAHKAEKHALLAESDFGADRIWRIDSYVAPAAISLIDDIAADLRPLGVARGNNDARGGSDIGPLAMTGVPVISLRQDGTRYFDLHHTPDDTLDKIDPAQLQQNVAVWSAMIARVANSTVEPGPVAPRVGE